MRSVATGALAFALVLTLGLRTAAPARAAEFQSTTPRSTTPASTGFVTARDGLLMVDGQPFRFVGANLAIMHGPENRAAAADVLQGAARDGLRVGRVWALGEGDSTSAPWVREHFLFRAGPDDWIESAARQFDVVLAEAARSGLRLIVTLSNHWSDYGGVPKYLRWFAGGKDDEWKDDVYGARDRFYSDPRAQAAFRIHVERLLRRTNRLTGRAYRDDPAILAWELMNESTVETEAGARARRRWIDGMARFIHEIDHNHLVMSGVSGYRLQRERDEWLRVCQIPSIDICDGHVYPEESLRGRDEAATEAGVDATIDDFVQLSRFVARKPFVLGEFGVRRASVDAPETVWQGHTRADWFERVFQRLRFDGAAGGLVWIYQRAGGADRIHGIGMDGDPSATAVRKALHESALAIAGNPGTPPADENPALGFARGKQPLLPLHIETPGATADVAQPATLPDGYQLTWDPVNYARADWEATGQYAGGALEHVWGSEVGWFEYAFDMPASSLALTKGVRSVELHARVSSEFPGTRAPPNGQSNVSVTLDGVTFGNASAARDDGLGSWVTLRTSSRAILARMVQPGPHALRIAVRAGAHAHGLCIYGGLGAKPKSGIEPGRITLKIATAIGDVSDVRPQR